MIEALPLFHRIAGQPVIVVGKGEAAEAKRRLVERAGGIVIADIAQGIEQGARLAFVADESNDAAQAAVARLRQAGLLVNAADRPDLCDFTVPSILDRNPVLIAIGTAGASAGLAKALRLRLERILPQSLGLLASVLGKSRAELRKRWPDAGDRRRALDAALDEGGALDPLHEDSAGRVEAWLGAAATVEPAGRIEILLASDDPEDLTLRQARLLGSADCIAYEPDVPTSVLDRARADAARQAIGTGAEPVPTNGLVVVLRR